MTDAVAVAFITTAGTVLALSLKRWWDVADRRRDGNANEREECERYRVAFRELLHYARQVKQSVVAIEAIRAQNPNYAMARLTELAHESNEIFDRLCDYVAGKTDELR